MNAVTFDIGAGSTIDSVRSKQWLGRSTFGSCCLWLCWSSLQQLEDDVVSKPGFLTVMKSFAYQQKSNDWLLLEFSTLGFIGQSSRLCPRPVCSHNISRASLVRLPMSCL